MELVDERIVVHSVAYFYAKEYEGVKPYTVRLVDDRIMRIIRTNPPKRITIKEASSKGRLFFTRKITDISVLGTIIGKTILGIAWDPKEAPEE